MEARSFEQIRKDAGVNSVHVTTALGNENGKRKARTFRDALSTVTVQKQEQKRDSVPVRVAKVDQSLGLVFGWAIICKENGKDYFDLNVDQAGAHKGELVPEHVTEDAMTKAALGLAQVGAPGNEMHEGPDKGHYPFLFPLTTDIAKALGIETAKTGLLVAYKPPSDVFAKFVSGEYRGFSIEGSRLDWETLK